MNKRNENLVNISKRPRFYIGVPFESLYLENAHYPIAIIVLKALLYILKRKKICKKKKFE